MQMPSVPETICDGEYKFIKVLRKGSVLLLVEVATG